MEHPLKAIGRERAYRDYRALTTLYLSANAIHLATLILTLVRTDGGVKYAFFAFFIQQPLEAFGEVFTGHFADLRGRRRSVVRGFVFSMVACLLFGVVGAQLIASNAITFALLFAAQLLYLFGATYISGALDAWAYDTLVYYETTEVDRKQRLACVELPASVGVLTGGMVGLAVLFGTGLTWSPWVIAAALFAVVAVYAQWAMNEPYREYGSAPNVLDALFAIRGDRRIRRAVVGYTVAWAMQYALWVYATYFWLQIITDYLARGAVLSREYLLSWLTVCWILWALSRIGAVFRIREWLHRHPELKKRQRLTFACALLSVLPLALWIVVMHRWQLAPIPQALLFVIAAIGSKTFEAAVKPLRAGLLNAAITNYTARSLILSLSNAGGAFFALLIFLIFVGLERRWPSTTADVQGLIGIGIVIAGAGAMLYPLIGVDSASSQEDASELHLP